MTTMSENTPHRNYSDGKASDWLPERPEKRRYAMPRRTNASIKPELEQSTPLLPPILSNQGLWMLGIGLGLIVTAAVGGIGLIGSGKTESILVLDLIGWALIIISIAGGFSIAMYLLLARLNWLIRNTDSVSRKLIGPETMEKIENELRSTTQLLNEIQSEAFKDLITEANRTGLIHLYSQRQQLPNKIRKLVHDAQKEVVFVGVSVTTALDMADFDNMMEAGIDTHNVKYRFLFLRSNSIQTENGSSSLDFFEQRAKDEGGAMTPERLKEDAIALKKFLEELKARFKRKLGGKYNNNVQYREYSAFPYLSMIIVDDVMYVGPYLFGINCANMPMFQFKKKPSANGIYSTYYQHYKGLWEASTSVEEEALSQQ